TARAGTAERDGHFARLAVKLLNRRAATVHLDLREVPTEEVRDLLAQVVVAALTLGAHARRYARTLLRPLDSRHRGRTRSPARFRASWCIRRAPRRTSARRRRWP